MIVPTEKDDELKPLHQNFTSKCQIQIQDETATVYEGRWAKEVCFRHNGRSYFLMSRRSPDSPTPDPNEIRFFNSFRYY